MSGTISQTIRALGQWIPIPINLARRLGLEEAALLMRLHFCMDRCSNEDGWIYKSVAELEFETSLTYKQQVRVRERLRDVGLIEERYDAVKHMQYFRIREEALDALILDSTSTGEKEAGIGETEGGHLTKGKEVAYQREGTSLPKVSSFYSSEEVLEEKQKEPTLQASQAKTEDASPEETHKQCKRIYRRHVGKTLGSLGNKRAEFSNLVRRKGSATVVAAVEMWAKELGRRGRELQWPLAVFLKQCDEYIEAVEQPALVEEEANANKEDPAEAAEIKALYDRYTYPTPLPADPIDEERRKNSRENFKQLAEAIKDIARRKTEMK